MSNRWYRSSFHFRNQVFSNYAINSAHNEGNFYVKYRIAEGRQIFKCKDRDCPGRAEEVNAGDNEVHITKNHRKDCEQHITNFGAVLVSNIVHSNQQPQQCAEDSIGEMEEHLKHSILVHFEVSELHIERTILIISKFERCRNFFFICMISILKKLRNKKIILSDTFKYMNKR
jgi:hypothetical protein